MGQNYTTGYGRANRSKLPDLEAFDMLPRPVRDALNVAKLDWSSAWCYNRLRKGRLTISQLIAAIEAGDEDKEHIDAPKVWGRSPPAPQGLMFEDL